MTTHAFPPAAAWLRPLLLLSGATAKRSAVTVSSDVAEVRLGWGFRVAFPRSTVASAEVEPRRVASLGAHGWRGRWLVNTTRDSLVRIELAPPARARVLGWPVRLRELVVSVTDPQALIRDLTPPLP